MNPVDLFINIIIIGVLVILVFFVIWALCVVASASDEISDEIWEEFCKKYEKEQEDNNE